MNEQHKVSDRFNDIMAHTMRHVYKVHGALHRINNDAPGNRLDNHSIILMELLA